MPWKPTVEVPDSHDKLRELMEAAYRIFGVHHAAGCIDDEFGGELYYIYRAPRPEKKPSIDDYVARRFRTADEQVAVSKLLPRARQKFTETVSDKLVDALGDLAQEVLWPLYQATGKTWRRNVTFHDPYDPDNPEKDRHEKHELKDGRVVRRKVKQFKPGGNEKITYPKLESAFKALGKQASQKTVAARLGVTVRGLRKWTESQDAESWKDVQDYYQRQGK